MLTKDKIWLNKESTCSLGDVLVRIIGSFFANNALGNKYNKVENVNTWAIWVDTSSPSSAIKNNGKKAMIEVDSAFDKVKFK